MESPFADMQNEVQVATRKAANALHELAELLIVAVPTLGEKAHFRGQFWETALVFTDGPGDGRPYVLIHLYGANRAVFSETLDF